MGILSDVAQGNSKFLIINKGESVVARYVGFEIIPNQRDPDLKTIQYKFSVNGQNKYWTNSNGNIMRLFDVLPKESFVKITRNKWLNKDGTEDVSKSSYDVQPVVEATK